MQYTITPVKAKITDAQASDIMNVQINQDNGTSCQVIYNIGYNGPAANGQPAGFQAMLPGTGIKVTGDDYTAYAAANTSLVARFAWAASYIATKVPSIVIAD